MWNGPGSILALGGAVGCALCAPAACASGLQAQDFALPAQPLGDSLRAVALASGRNIVVPAALVAGKRAPALNGRMTADAAVAFLLRGSGLRARITPAGMVVEQDNAAVPQGSASPPADEIVVTGSRIRGAPAASPVIVLAREAIRNGGQASLGEVVRSLPQSFGGGQNPGIGTNVPGANGVDVGGGSSINLRGLGSDATLTLLNGHRLSYSGSRQSIDVSGIPLAALDRIEIVADGASALYGSDAVAGVANIILRRDYQGVETRARIGAATDGGDVDQQYGLLAGTRWGTGGVFAVYQYGRSAPIEADQRSYAATHSPGLTLFPALRQHSALLSGHQDIAAGLSLDLDALYNKRWSSTVFPLNFAGDLSVSGGRTSSVAESYSITPTLRLALGGDWRLALNGVYGRDRIDYAAELWFGGTHIPAGAGYYRNTTKSVDLGGDGGLFRLPGGIAKLAVGAGYRAIDFASFKGGGSYQNLVRSQDSWFAYGELGFPLVSPAQGLALLYRLNLSAALRYERYPGIGKVATPKLGLVYAPTADLDLKASWGKSFRAPTLLEQYDPSSVTLEPAAADGGTGYPASATVLTLEGGNPRLRPERATTWSATLDFHPRAVPGARIALSYFSTHYRDRIVTPVTFLSVALSNPIYRDQVTLDPSDAAKAQAIANAGTFVNATDSDYVPGDVVAIIDNDSVNAGRQSIHGLDLALAYSAKLGGGTLGATLDGAWLESDQQLSATQPVLPLAGTLFNPPHLRGRGSLSWEKGGLTLTGVANYTGGVRDPRVPPGPWIAALTSIDLSVRYRTKPGTGWLGGLDLSLSLLNAFNAKPANIATSIFTATPYDSTNYSPVGRFVAFAVSKKW